MLLAIPTSLFSTRQTTTRLEFRSIALKRFLSAMGRRSPSPESRYTSKTSSKFRSAPSARSIFHLTKQLQSAENHVMVNKKTLWLEWAEVDALLVQCVTEVLTRRGGAVRGGLDQAVSLLSLHAVL